MLCEKLERFRAVHREVEEEVLYCTLQKYAHTSQTCRNRKLRKLKKLL